MIGKITQLWRWLKNIETAVALMMLTVGPGGVGVLLYQNAPDWMIIALVVAISLTAFTLPGLAVWYRYGKVAEDQDRQMRQIRDSFGALWDYANEKGLMEHAEHDKEMREHMDELRLSLYGRPITPHSSLDTPIPRSIRPQLRNSRRRRGWR